MRWLQVYNPYAFSSVREYKCKYKENNPRTTTKNLSVTKSEENTRSHPEHGRKDSHRWKYLAGHRLGR